MEELRDARLKEIVCAPTLKISFFKNSNYDSFRNCTSDVSKVELKTQKTIVIDHYSGLGIQQNRSWEGSWSTIEHHKKTQSEEPFISSRIRT